MYDGIPGFADQASHKVDGRSRAIAVTFASTPKEGNTYGKGETIAFDVEFNRVVAVRGPDDLYFRFNVGSRERRAYYKGGGTGTTTLTFQYTVVSADSDSDAADNRPVGSGAARSSAGTGSGGRGGRFVQGDLTKAFLKCEYMFLNTRRVTPCHPRLNGRMRRGTR